MVVNVNIEGKVSSILENGRVNEPSSNVIAGTVHLMGDEGVNPCCVKLVAIGLKNALKS